MKTITAMISLVLLAACQSEPKLQEDVRYLQLATVVDVHEFTETARKQAQANAPRDSKVGVGIGVGVGRISGGGSFGGVTLGMGTAVDGRRDSDEMPQVAKGANRYTVKPLASDERIELMSYGRYKVGDCVRLFSGHPTAFPRILEPMPAESCK